MKVYRVKFDSCTSRTFVSTLLYVVIHHKGLVSMSTSFFRVLICIIILHHFIRHSLFKTRKNWNKSYFKCIDIQIY